MIGAIEGMVFRKTSESLILMTGGVGYRIFVTQTLLGQVKIDSKLLLHTYTHVREDILSLFGFQTTEELQLFELLLAVSGIGPKTALTIVNRGVVAISRAIATADVTFFTSIPRLGRKNAQKVIIELKPKLGSINELNLSDEDRSETAEIIEVLVSVGFSRPEISKILPQLPVDQTLENKIKTALKLLGKA